MCFFFSSHSWLIAPSFGSESIEIWHCEWDWWYETLQQPVNDSQYRFDVRFEIKTLTIRQIIYSICYLHKMLLLNNDFECIIQSNGMKRKKNSRIKSKASQKLGHWTKSAFALTHPRIDVRASITRDSIINCYDIFRLCVFIFFNSNAPSQMKMSYYIILKLCVCFEFCCDLYARQSLS